MKAKTSAQCLERNPQDFSGAGTDDERRKFGVVAFWKPVPGLPPPAEWVMSRQVGARPASTEVAGAGLRRPPHLCGLLRPPTLCVKVRSRAVTSSCQHGNL